MLAQGMRQTTPPDRYVLFGFGPAALPSVSSPKQQQKPTKPGCWVSSPDFSLSFVVGFYYKHYPDVLSFECSCSTSLLGQDIKRIKEGSYRINLYSPLQSKMADISSPKREDAGMPFASDPKASATIQTIVRPYPKSLYCIPYFTLPLRSISDL